MAKRQAEDEAVNVTDIALDGSDCDQTPQSTEEHCFLDMNAQIDCLQVETQSEDGPPQSTEEPCSFDVNVEVDYRPVEIQEAEDGIIPTSNDSKQQSSSSDDEKLDLRRQYLTLDMRQYPREKIGALLVLWIVLFVITLLQGGRGIESIVGIQCDSPWYYVMIAIQFLWLFCFAAYFGHKLTKDQEARVAVDYPYLGSEDPAWDMRSVRLYGALCFLSGIVSALIGISGGMILGPMMLFMGVDPRVSSATNASMVVVNSSSVAFMAVTQGLIPWSYALFYFCVTFSGAVILKTRIDRYVKRTGRASLLVFILASIIAFATIGCFVSFFTGLSDKGWCFDDFEKFCTISNPEDCPVDRMLAAFL
jgi:Sulfite exporter TauE/SafE